MYMYEMVAYWGIISCKNSISNITIAVSLLDLQLPMQSVPITTDVVHEFESRSGWGVQHYVIKLVSEL